MVRKMMPARNPRWLFLAAIMAACPVPSNASAQDDTGDASLRSQSSQLPWRKERRSAAAPKLKPASGPVELLARYGIGDSQWEGFFSGQPLSPAEEEVLVRLLYHFPRFGQENVESWAQRGVTWDQIAAEPQSYRGKIVRLAGRAISATRAELIPELTARYEFRHYYQVRVQLEGAPYLAVVYCREIPSAWRLDKELSQPVTAYGLFLKVGDLSDDPPTLLFATGRVAWHPDRPDKDLMIDGAHVALAKLGVDLGRIQEVGREKGTGILVAEREPFYQVLAAVADERAGELLRPEDAPLDVVAILQSPESQQGHVLPLRGIARRVARIDVPDADIRQRFGIDHYFEIDMTVPLARTIRLGADPRRESDAVVYENGFPATICVRQLPPGLEVGDEARQLVQADGVFFKVWNYPSAYTSAANLVQPAPLLLARTVQVVREESPSRWFSDALVGAAIGLAALTFVVIVIWYRWSDRSGPRRKARADAAAPKPDFSNMG